MSLLSEAQSERRRPGFACGIQRLLETLSPEEQAELDEALTSTVSHSALSRALQRRKQPISQQTIQRHRAGTCSCP